MILESMKNNLPHVMEATEQSKQRESLVAKTATPKMSNVMVEVCEWWREQLAYSSESSDDDF